MQSLIFFLPFVFSNYQKPPLPLIAWRKNVLFWSFETFFVYPFNNTSPTQKSFHSCYTLSFWSLLCYTLSSWSLVGVDARHVVTCFLSLVIACWFSHCWFCCCFCQSLHHHSPCLCCRSCCSCAVCFIVVTLLTDLEIFTAIHCYCYWYIATVLFKYFRYIYWFVISCGFI